MINFRDLFTKEIVVSHVELIKSDIPGIPPDIKVNILLTKKFYKSNLIVVKKNLKIRKS